MAQWPIKIQDDVPVQFQKAHIFISKATVSNFRVGFCEQNKREKSEFHIVDPKANDPVEVQRCMEGIWARS